MSLSEVMIIQVLFHLPGYKTFREFYLVDVSKYFQIEFPDLVSYHRMVGLKRDSFMPLATYLKTSGLANCLGISFIDSTPLRVCDRRGIHQYKTFKDIAQRGPCSLGWFHGFEFRIVTNDNGGIIDFIITKGNADDRKSIRFK